MTNVVTNVLRYLYKRKNILLYMIFVVAALLAFSFGFSHAYYEPVNGDAAVNTVVVDNKTIDSFYLGISGNMNFPVVTQDNFGPSATANLSASVTATASLKANNSRASDTYNYYFYLLGGSDFVYSDTTNNQAELLLQVTYNDVEITPSNKATYGLDFGEVTYKTSNSGLSTEVSGWDITTANFVTIANNKAMSAARDELVTDQYQITVVMVKLNGVDQSPNYGKYYRGRLIMKKDEPINVANITYSNSLTSCTDVNCAIKELYSAVE